MHNGASTHASSITFDPATIARYTSKVAVDPRYRAPVQPRKQKRLVLGDSCKKEVSKDNINKSETTVSQKRKHIDNNNSSKEAIFSLPSFKKLKSDNLDNNNKVPTIKPITNSQQSQPQQSKPQPSKPQPSKPQPSKPQPSKPQPSKPQPSKPQPSKPQPSKLQLSKQQIYKPHVSKPQTAKQSTKPLTGEPKTAKSATATLHINPNTYKPPYTLSVTQAEVNLQSDKQITTASKHPRSNSKTSVQVINSIVANNTPKATLSKAVHQYPAKLLKPVSSLKEQQSKTGRKYMMETNEYEPDPIADKEELGPEEKYWNTNYSSAIQNLFPHKFSHAKYNYDDDDVLEAGFLDWEEEELQSELAGMKEDQEELKREKKRKLQKQKRINK